MTDSARQAGEAVLQQNIQYNTEHAVLPSESAVARRLLARGDELEAVYGELLEKLGRREHGLSHFLGLLLSTRAFWGPEQIAQARADRAALASVNAQIAAQADALADLLDERDRLNNTSGFSSRTHYNMADVIAEASRGNGLFQTFLRDPLERLRRQFDLKYWPSPGNCLRALASDAAAASPEASDPLTDAATASTRPSRSDFVMALFAAIDESRGDYAGSIPKDFQISDNAMATLVNILLELPPEEMVDAPYVKRRRQRARELLQGER